jgi:pimeloyl-ACP methyl ester carboxylesterase
LRRFIVAGLCLALVALALLPRLTLHGQEEQAKPADIVFRESLVIPPVGRSGRSAIHNDAIEALIVAGKWKAPQADDEVKLPDGAVRKWEAAKAKDDGWFEGPALRGGYAFVTVPSEEQKVMLLDASGHNMVYVNGEPRTGDPYQTGYVRLPVLLKKGDNEFLFHVGRGRLRAKLLPPIPAVQFDAGDVTLPDLVVGEETIAFGSIVLHNASCLPLKPGLLSVKVGDERSTRMLWEGIPALRSRKVLFEIRIPPPKTSGTVPLLLALLDEDNKVIAKTELRLRIVGRDATRKRTFISDIDSSVQYYAVTPMANTTLKPNELTALFLTLHGAGVEALGQASCYAAKSWGHVVAPTNRRPFGFDWEDWGRLDALEVLQAARNEFGVDPRKIFLTGHSMGGHGVWQLGALFPDRWAAIAPSAGWISMYSYAGARRPQNSNPREEMLLRAAASSDTLAMLKNYGHHGVYVLHGEKDDNVPVSQAREMRRHLADFHSDFVYYERPGAGHWWGNECVDWPPIFEFFARRAIPEAKHVRQVEFTTVNPGVSSESHWASIEAQLRPMKPSMVRLQQDIDKRTFSGSTENVARLSLDVFHLKHGEAISVELDGQKFERLPWPAKGWRVWFSRQGERWSADVEPAPRFKGPHRAGPFKDALRERMLFVYGTKGTPEENAWAFAKARYDAEVFWYRANGSIEVIADTEYHDSHYIGRSVILYGNADTNAAWPGLLKDCPVQVRRGEVRVGNRLEKAEDMACLFLQPRPGTAFASIAAVSGTGLAGMRLTDRIPYFVSGVGIPDLLVLDSSTLTKGSDGIVVAGFFGNDWSAEKGEFAWRP